MVGGVGHETLGVHYEHESLGISEIHRPPLKSFIFHMFQWFLALGPFVHLNSPINDSQSFEDLQSSSVFIRFLALWRSLHFDFCNTDFVAFPDHPF